MEVYIVGKMEKVPLREVWEKEAKDFTTWLFDNLNKRMVKE